MSVSDLSHVFVPFGNDGGEVILLDQGAVLGPEHTAMLAAIYSRSGKGFRHHIGIVEKRGPDKFMRDTFVGFGHQSVGDNGALYLFIENISLLAAKEVQDYPLYNGQEMSTRYLDFTDRTFIDPDESTFSKNLLERLRAFYLKILNAMIPELRSRYPLQEGEGEKEYEKAIKARAFDIARAFLPGGASTSVEWTGMIRHVSDRLPHMRNHVLREVRDMGNAIEDAVLAKHPNSFRPKDKRYEDTELYLRNTARLFEYYPSEYFNDLEYSGGEWFDSQASINYKLLRAYRPAFESRPVKTDLPYIVRDCGTMRYEFPLDFGSYRDLQRHRALSIPMPLLTTEFGFEPWYLSELPDELRQEAVTFLAAYVADMKTLPLPPDLLQYYVPIGYRCPIRMTGDLRALVYVVELRATRFVHPTLRVRARQVASDLLHRFGEWGLVLHLDQEPDRFDVKRGTQDITIRDE